MILFSKYMVPKGYSGITIFPFVILRHYSLKQDSVLINHEKIHLKQQLELLVLPFFIIYSFEFLIRLFQYKSWNLAYKQISFEREAYVNEKDLNYLKSRSFWSFIKYF
ncbi:hypothetical protein [Xanthomarina spongicola]|nr:hypothetical protein [Xanthomarina spongicola]